jgi:small-conductance mechanosensitive channel
MKFDIQTIYQFIPAAAFLLGSILIGVIFERLILRRLKKFAQKTSWRGVDIIIESLQKRTFLLFLIAGIYGALYSLPFLKKSILSLLTNILIVILIFLVTLAIGRIAAGLVTLYSKSSKTALPESSIIPNITKLFVILIGLLIIMQYLGVSITPILTALGVGGLAVALALQETLSNLFSGIHIIVTGQIKLGDYIKLETGEEGHVVDITWRNSTIRTILNNLVIIPNSKLASTIITNYSLPAQEVSVMVPVGVSYGSDLEKVEQVTIDVARSVMKESRGGIPDFEPYIRYHTFDDFSINFNVILKAREYIDMYPLKHEFVKRLHKRYKAEGIEIPFPIRTVYMKDNQEKKEQ